jgi:hypothetical protein
MKKGGVCQEKGVPMIIDLDQGCFAKKADFISQKGRVKKSCR